MKKSKVVGLTSIIVLLGITIYYFYPEEKLTEGQKADKIVINKANHELLLFDKEKLIATYKVSLGRNGLGKKTKSGDWLTPEGSFKGKKRLPSQTKYHKAIAIGEWGDCCAVLIHGLEYSWIGKFHRWLDWTKGCIELTNDEIDEIYKAVNDGVIIEINP